MRILEDFDFNNIEDDLTLNIDVNSLYTHTMTFKYQTTVYMWNVDHKLTDLRRYYMNLSMQLNNVTFMEDYEIRLYFKKHNMWKDKNFEDELIEYDIDSEDTHPVDYLNKHKKSTSNQYYLYADIKFNECKVPIIRFMEEFNNIIRFNKIYLMNIFMIDTNDMVPNPNISYKIAELQSIYNYLYKIEDNTPVNVEILNKATVSKDRLENIIKSNLMTFIEPYHITYEGINTEYYIGNEYDAFTIRFDFSTVIDKNYLDNLDVIIKETIRLIKKLPNSIKKNHVIFFTFKCDSNFHFFDEIENSNLVDSDKMTLSGAKTTGKFRRIFNRAHRAKNMFIPGVLKYNDSNESNIYIAFLNKKNKITDALIQYPNDSKFLKLIHDDLL